MDAILKAANCILKRQIIRVTQCFQLTIAVFDQDKDGSHTMLAGRKLCLLHVKYSGLAFPWSRLLRDSCVFCEYYADCIVVLHYIQLYCVLCIFSGIVYLHFFIFLFVFSSVTLPYLHYYLSLLLLLFTFLYHSIGMD